MRAKLYYLNSQDITNDITKLPQFLLNRVIICHANKNDDAIINKNGLQIISNSIQIYLIKIFINAQQPMSSCTLIET